LACTGVATARPYLSILIAWLVGWLGWVGLGWVGLGWVGLVGLVGWLVGWWSVAVKEGLCSLWDNVYDCLLLPLPW
jgi:hypothetical protein